MALLCALMLMLGTLILGVSIARTASASMASSRLERERVLALAAAQAALADAEADLAGGAQPSSARAAWFAAGSGGFAAGCGHGSQDLGLCLTAAAPLPPPWQAIDLAQDDAPLVPLGRYTGAVLALGGGILPARLPAYLIERLEAGGASANANAGAGAGAGTGTGTGTGAGPPSATLYRITAIGFGTRPKALVVLQALYRKPAPAAAPPAGQDEAPASPETQAPAQLPAADGIAAEAATAPRAGRIAWREIANWPELHAQALQ